MTLLPPGVPVGEVPAGPDGDLQARGVGVEGQSQFQLSCRADALKEPEVCVDAAAAAAAALKVATQSKRLVSKRRTDDTI